MAAGGMAGLNDIKFPAVELWIASSLVGLGLGIAASERLMPKGVALPIWLVALFVAVFGIAHGNAHCLEVPQSANPTLFAVGFLIGTSAIHIAGVSLGLVSIARPGLASAIRIAGCFAAALGLGLMVRG